MDNYLNQIKIKNDYKEVRNNYVRTRKMMNLVNSVFEYNHIKLQKMNFHKAKLLEAMSILDGLAY